MPEKYQLDSALGIAKSLVGSHPDPSSPVSVLAGLASRFADVEFDVPNLPDSDGYLFQYGRASWFAEPTFVISLARQLEVAGPDGGHEAYLQVQFEFRYPLDGDLESAGNRSEWWFPGESMSFNEWLKSIEGFPISSILARKRYREFEVWQDQV